MEGSSLKVSDRQFDVVVFGASGFTGRLVCEYLAKNYCLDSNSNGQQQQTVGGGATVRYAIAGRNYGKLKRMLEDISRECNNPNILNNVPIIRAAVDDDTSLKAMCARTHVVLNLVGPYMKYGEPVVRACVERSTNYCDISAELPFVYGMQSRYNEIAQEKKIKIVHFCGFDSIPSDLGTMLVQQEALKRWETPCHSVRMRFTKLFGGFSGGTISSGANMYTSMSKEERRKFSSPYCLCTDEERIQGNERFAIKVKETDQRRLGMVHFEDDVGYVTDFVMSDINSSVVRWTNHKLNYLYGSNFKYSEGMAHLKLNFITAYILNFFMKFVVKMMFFPPIFWILSKTILPKPGEGPSPRVLQNGYFFSKVFGESTKGRIIALVGSDKGDPGYKETAKMLAECGLSIALENSKCNNLFGVLSPASGIGCILIDRLNKAGMVF